MRRSCEKEGTTELRLQGRTKRYSTNTATASSLAKDIGGFSITNANRAYMLGTDQPLNQLH